MRQVNLVNDQDQIVGHKDLVEAHRGNGLKHQAISLFLFCKRDDGVFDLLLQQRSSKKIVGALQWANTICANLIPGENHLQAIERRLFEELGITWNNNLPLKEVMVFDYQIPCEDGFCENEIDHIFVSVLNEKQLSGLEISPNLDEVVDYALIDWELVKAKKLENRELTPWFNLFISTPKIIGEIDRVLK